jgi:iron uptake system component EfeO
MFMRGSRLLIFASAAGLVAAVAACGATSPAPTAGDVAVTASDSTCQLARTELAAGVTRFVITNTGKKITEFYLFRGDAVLGEVENISPGATRSLSVELKEGSHVGVCKPGMVGSGIKQAFTVKGSAASLSEDAKLAAAVEAYTKYVQSQADLLVVKTKAFTDAIRAGDITKAKQLFAAARGPYETIEPPAETFGDLDPAIDARDGDLEAGTPWTGFHALEKHLWVDNDISQDKALADRLDADVAKLVTLVRTIELQPLAIANGAKELLDEVATSKVTGEEDRYSHTDLWDIAANVAGAEAAIDSLGPALAERDATLMTNVDSAHDAVEAALAAHKVGDGWKLYTELTPAETKALADAISGLAEPVSKVAAAISAPNPAAS